MIKDTMDKKFGASWHAVVGEGYGFEITHEVKNLLYMFFGGNLAICVWKCSWCGQGMLFLFSFHSYFFLEKCCCCFFKQVDQTLWMAEFDCDMMLYQNLYCFVFFWDQLLFFFLILCMFVNLVSFTFRFFVRHHVTLTTTHSILLIIFFLYKQIWQMWIFTFCSLHCQFIKQNWEKVLNFLRHLHTVSSEVI